MQTGDNGRHTLESWSDKWTPLCIHRAHAKTAIRPCRRTTLASPAAPWGRLPSAAFSMTLPIRSSSTLPSCSPGTTLACLRSTEAHPLPVLQHISGHRFTPILPLGGHSGLSTHRRTDESSHHQHFTRRSRHCPKRTDIYAPTIDQPRQRDTGKTCEHRSCHNLIRSKTRRWHCQIISHFTQGFFCLAPYMTTCRSSLSCRRP